MLDTKERGDWLAKAISLKRAHEFAAAEKRKREKDERKYLSLKHAWEMRKLAAEKRYAEKKREKLRLENEALDNKNKELGKRKRKELEEEDNRTAAMFSNLAIFTLFFLVFFCGE